MRKMIVILSTIAALNTANTAKAKSINPARIAVLLSGTSKILWKNEKVSVSMTGALITFFVPQIQNVGLYTYTGPKFSFNLHKSFKLWLAPQVGIAANAGPTGQSFLNLSLWAGWNVAGIFGGFHEMTWWVNANQAVMYGYHAITLFATKYVLPGVQLEHITSLTNDTINWLGVGGHMLIPVGKTMVIGAEYYYGLSPQPSHTLRGVVRLFF